MTFASSNLSVRLLAIAIFLASGAAGMVYEISWARQFGNVFGHTVDTGAMVLASFLGGMAVGYWLAGKYRGQRNPLIAYGVLEIIAGAWACVVPSLLSLAAASPLGSLESGPLGSLAIGRVVFCFLALLPATAALGGTWPFMAAVLSPADEPATRWLSVGYATNTVGAMVGSVLATAYLLVIVGVTRSSFLAASVSAACGFIAIALSIVFGRARLPPSREAEKNSAAQISLPWYLLAAISGFSILALEVLYLRLFSLVFHNSTYTFGCVVTIFLLALALGSYLTGVIGKRVSPTTVVAWSCGIGAISIVVSIAIFSRWTEFRYFSEGDSFHSYIAAALGLVAGVVLLPVTALGMILPTTWRANEPQGMTESHIAGLTAVSTVAGAIGSLATSFLLPLTGLWGSFAAIVVVYLAISITILAQQRAAGQLLLLTVWSSAAYFLNWLELHDATTLEKGETLLHRWESAYGWIDAVEQSGGNRLVRQNLHYGFGSSRNSVQRDYRSGHLPLLLHGAAKEVLFLGMGTGQTAAAALQHDELQSIVVVELIPEAVEAARFLQESNRGLVDSPRVEIHTTDARRFLTGSNRKFDVITADLFVPWESHTGYLYTVEHYRAGKNSLKPGGIFCQWLAVYQLGPAEFEMIANSFASVFPHTRLWWVRTNGNYPVLGLIGSDQPIDYAKTAAAAGYLETDPHTGQRDAWLADGNAILASYIGDWPAPQADAVLNTDEHPRVEFSAPLTHADNLKLRGKRIRTYFQDVLAKLPQTSIETRDFTGDAQSRDWRLKEQRRLLGID